MATFTADQVLDNKIRVHKPVTLHQGTPESGINVIELPSGRITPVVLSWVKRNGSVYWQFNELGTPYYLKHDPGFDIVEFSGGSQYIQPAAVGFPDLFNNFGGNVADTVQVLKKVAIGAGVIYGGVMAYNIYQATNIKKQLS